MSKRLLHTTLRAYMTFSLAVVFVSAPFFYWVTEKLYVDEADETLLLIKNEFHHHNLPTFRIADIPNWNNVNRNLRIGAPVHLLKDSLFRTFYFDTLADEHEPYRVLFSPIIIEGHPYTLQAKLNLVETEDMIISIVGLFCVTLCVLLAGLYLITRLLSARLWRPFYVALEQIEKFELDTAARPIWQTTNIEEFKRLNQSIDNLLARNIDVYQRQREFVENAAHELQTPLAIFQARLDTLAQQLPLNPELSETLSSLAEATSRLTRTNKNLLLLARIDKQQFPLAERVAIAEVVDKHLDFFREQALEKNITLIWQSGDPLWVEANVTLVEIAISNLLLNALRHNVRDGKIHIEVGEQTLTVANSGSLAALPIAQLFKRFSNQGSPGSGSGLGLSIVKKIAELYAWTINYTFEDNRHIFRLRF